MDNEKSKFGAAEMVIGGTFFLALDAGCALLDLTGVGAATIAPLTQTFTTFGISMWARSKGATLSVGPEIAKYASNALPLVPTTTLIFFITAGLQNEWFGSAISEAVEKAGAISKTGTGPVSNIKK